MRPLVRSYGVSSTSTSSPVSTRMRFLRILPAVWPRISWPFSRRTRNIAFGSSSTTCPRISSNSSLAKCPSIVSSKSRGALAAGVRKGKLRSGRIIFVEERFETRHPVLFVRAASEIVAAFLVEHRRDVCAGFGQRIDHRVALPGLHVVVLLAMGDEDRNLQAIGKVDRRYRREI